MKLGISGAAIAVAATLGTIAACYACTVAIDPCSSKSDNCSARIEIMCVQIILPNGQISDSCVEAGVDAAVDGE
jgi:hypothetical protein